MATNPTPAAMNDDHVYETRYEDWGFGQVRIERITRDGAAVEAHRIILPDHVKERMSCGNLSSIKLPRKSLWDKALAAWRKARGQ